MRKLITSLVVAAGLTFGMATPASAHHTHSPTSLCNYYRPGGYTSLTPHTHYYASSLHPAAAHCYYRSNTTFQLYVTCRRYDTHAIVSASTWCPHG